ncbi:class I SAM-dependent methyltransferase [Micromonospora sp. C51]|uniref:class I SAM-dependent methyltransferase n=1 Tax=Micromonospora sp. C51 TaxID=2824879 RepID=UPI001FFD7190
MSAQYIALFDGGGQAHANDTALIRDHLGGLDGAVLDLGCGPGHWTAYLHSLGVEVTGIDLVPEFIDHARANFPGPAFRLGSMTELDVPDHSVAGVLSWYSTIHLPPPELDHVLTEFRRMLTPSGRLVIGFFDSEDEVAEFDHKVLTAYRWPVDEFSARLTRAGFTELQRLQQQIPDRPDRRYAAIAATAT